MDGLPLRIVVTSHATLDCPEVFVSSLSFESMPADVQPMKRIQPRRATRIDDDLF
jgi:hypothetical protein